MKNSGHAPGFDAFPLTFRRDLGIDLGTANTLVYVAGRGIVLREPSVVAVNRDTGEVVAVGTAAKEMLGRTPLGIEAIRPLKDGVIADYEQALLMLQHMIWRASRGRALRQTVVIGIPTGVTEVERRAVIEAAKKAGATQAFVIDEPMAAAIGSGLPVHDPVGSMVVDIGGGTTEVAVISMGGIVQSRSIRIAGDEIDEAIAAYARRAHNLYIGEKTAEQTKIEIGSAYPLKQELSFTVRGRDLVTGLPRSATITSDEVRMAIADPITAIIEAVKFTLEETPPELAADCISNGIMVTGGGALLRGMAKRIADETEVPVKVAEDPLGSVALGAGKAVEWMRTRKWVRKMLERYTRA